MINTATLVIVRNDTTIECRGKGRAAIQDSSPTNDAAHLPLSPLIEPARQCPSRTLFSASSGSPTLPDWLGSRVFDWVFRADAENDKYASHLRTSAGVAVFIAERSDKDHWVRVGRACQRFALQATALGLKHAFVNQPVEVARFRPQLAAQAGMPGRRPDLLMRFGYGPTLPYSARRPAAILA